MYPPLLTQAIKLPTPQFIFLKLQAIKMAPNAACREKMVNALESRPL